MPDSGGADADADAESRPITPEARARGKPIGIPIEPSDGSIWFLAHGGVLRPLDSVRDVIRARGEADGSLDTFRDWECCGDVAIYMLQRNYDLTDVEAAGLVLLVPEDRLLSAVWLALFGDPGRSIGWSEWARCSLLAAGLDPDRVPPGDVNMVLDLLVRAGRIPPASDIVTAIRDADRARQTEESMAVWRAMAAQQKADREGADREKMKSTSPGEDRGRD